MLWLWKMSLSFQSLECRQVSKGNVFMLALRAFLLLKPFGWLLKIITAFGLHKVFELCSYLWFRAFSLCSNPHPPPKKLTVAISRYTELFLLCSHPRTLIKLSSKSNWMSHRHSGLKIILSPWLPSLFLFFNLVVRSRLIETMRSVT